MRKTNIMPKENLEGVINVPVTDEFKMLLVCYCRALGYVEHTPIARAILMKGLRRAIMEMTEEDRALMKTIARNTLIADKIEELMLHDIKSG